MKYEFEITDYDDIMDTINEREDVQKYGFKMSQAYENDEWGGIAYGWRIIIPDLGISIREGYVYDLETEEQECDSILIYPLDEKDPAKPEDSYSNISIEYLVDLLNDKGIEKINCIIDDEEFDLAID